MRQTDTVRASRDSEPLEARELPEITKVISWPNGKAQVFKINLGTLTLQFPPPASSGEFLRVPEPVSARVEPERDHHLAQELLLAQAGRLGVGT